MLIVLWHHPEREILIDALPIAGVDGTLVRSRDGQTLIFTLLVNGFDEPGSAARAVEDLIVEQLALFRRSAN